jgi:hypothetical protein
MRVLLRAAARIGDSSTVCKQQGRDVMTPRSRSRIVGTPSRPSRPQALCKPALGELPYIHSSPPTRESQSPEAAHGCPWRPKARMPAKSLDLFRVRPTPPPHRLTASRSSRSVTELSSRRSSISTSVPACPLRRARASSSDRGATPSMAASRPRPARRFAAHRFPLQPARPPRSSCRLRPDLPGSPQRWRLS